MLAMRDEHVDYEAAELVDYERSTAEFVQVDRKQLRVSRPRRVQRIDVGISCTGGSNHLNASQCSLDLFIYICFKQTCLHAHI